MNKLKLKLVKEKESLERKLDKLDAFLSSDKANEIDNAQKGLLHVQAAAMNTYLQCLKERIERI